MDFLKMCMFLFQHFTCMVRVFALNLLTCVIGIEGMTLFMFGPVNTFLRVSLVSRA